MEKLSRRSFIKRLAFAPEKKHGTASSFNDEILLFVFLRGGADTLNMVIPFGDDDYYRARPTISIKAAAKGNIDKELAHKVDDFYAFHPRLKPLLRPFKEGRLVYVQGVGSDNLTGSHFEAQDQMEHGGAFKQTSIQGGWLGRHLFYSRSKKSSPLAAVAISSTIPESLRGAPSVSAIQSIEEINLKVKKETADFAMTALADLYGECPDLLGKAGRDTINVLKKIDSIKSAKYIAEHEAQYPDDYFGKALTEVARLIKADLGLKVACVDHGGWDTHFIQGGASGLQAGNIDSLAKGLDAFDRDLKNYRNKVTVVVITEFGRRSYENSSLGTDHGRGFGVFLLSNKINGGKVLGKWPGMDENQIDLLGSRKVLRRIPGIKEEQQEALGPPGLSIAVDYRDVLWEVVENILGNKQVEKVFPGFSHRNLNLVKTYN